MLAVLVKTVEAVTVSAMVALAAGTAGLWWLRRKARQLVAAQAWRILGRAGRRHRAGLITERPLAAAAWRRQPVRLAWLLVRAQARRHDRGANVPAAR